MKRMKNLLSLVLALVMVMAMTLTAFASETESTESKPPVSYPEFGVQQETVTNNTTHTYKAYQIFSGTQSKDTGTSLGNVVWGQGIDGNGEELLQALKADPTLGTRFASSGTAADVAKVVSEFTEEEALAFAEIVAKHLDESKYFEVKKDETILVPAGYFLFIDQDGGNGAKDDAKNLYLLQITNDNGGIVLQQKYTVPTVDKQVQDEKSDVEEDGTGSEWGETADHQLNKSFKFKLTADLQADQYRDEYETYKVVFTDTMSEGVTFEQIDSVTIKIGDAEPIPINSNNYTSTATVGQAGGIWTLTIEDLRTLPGLNLVPGKEDELVLKKKAEFVKNIIIEVVYSAHLNDNAVVTNETGDSTANNNKVSLEYSNNPYGEGMGTAKEDTVYVFSFKVENTKYADGIAVGNELEGAVFALYRNDATNEKEYAVLSNGKVQGWQKWDPNSQNEECLITSAEDGTFNVEGLDVGTYYLEEVITPPGYNKCEDLEVVISATHSESEDGTIAHVDLENSKNLINDIVDKKGVTLPETGGIGTTIFTVSGIILVIIAGVLLVTKKRMSKEE